MNEKLDEEVKRESENGLKRFLRFIIDNPADWEAICNMEGFRINVKRRLLIMQKLEAAGLLSVAYLVLYLSADGAREIEEIKEQVDHELAARIPVSELINLIKNAMISGMK